MKIALIADLVNSKNIANRREFQHNLKTLLAQISKEHESLLASPYTITLGDEFQAVYLSTQFLLHDVIKILLFSREVSIRFCFGIDELTTEINPREALGMDGPAFHAARKDMSDHKKEKRSIISFSGKPDFRLVNSSLTIWSGAWDKWNFNTRQIFYALICGQEFSQLTGKLGISERAVYKTIKTHNLKDFHKLFTDLQFEVQIKVEDLS